MIQTPSTVMQLLKSSYFSVAAGSRHLMTQFGYRELHGTWIMFHLLQSEVEKIIVFKGIDFNLEVCVIMFLEAWTRADFFLKLLPSKLTP